MSAMIPYEPLESSAPNIQAQLSSLSPPERERLESRCRELESLIAMTAMTSDLTLMIGEPGSMWSFNFQAKLVSVPLNDLCEEDIDFCRGLTLHEAAHASVTRVFDLLMSPYRERLEVRELLNVIEDCRIETWLKERQPGSLALIEHYNDKIWRPMFAPPGPELYITQFHLALLARWGEKPDLTHLAPPVIEALERAWPSVDRAIKAHPPRFISSYPLIREVYEGNRMLTFTYMVRDLYDPPTDFERFVRVRQLQMLNISLQEVLPIYEELLAQDERERPKQLRQHLEMLRAQAAQSAQSAQHIMRPQQGYTEQKSDKGRPKAGDQEAVQKAFNPHAKDAYLKAWREHSERIDRLSDELLELFHKQSRTRWLSGYPTGSRVNLRAAMSFEAQPERYLSLWERKSHPHHIDPFFVFVLDISGSMSGENIDGAFQTLVLLSEVCTRLGVSFEVISFNRHASLVWSAERTLDEEGRLELAQLLEAPSGGTDFEPPLKMAYERFKSAPHVDRFMVFLSDGEANESEEVNLSLRRLARLNVHSVGLGVGSGTEGLKQFFSEGIYGVDPATVARRFTPLLRRLLRR